MAKDQREKAAQGPDPATATIRVRAVQPGYYHHIFRKRGAEFVLRPVLLPGGGVLSAQEQLSIDRKGRRGQFVRGWMTVLGSGAPAAAKPAPLVPQTKALDHPQPEDGSLPDPDLGGGEDAI